MIDLGYVKDPVQGPCWLDPEEIFAHMIIVGGTRTGKSTFLLNMIKNIEGGGKIILDPSGSIAPKVKAIYPDATHIHINHPISLNPLGRDHLSKSQLSEELVDCVNASIQAVTDNVLISAKMGRILREAIDILDVNLDMEYLSNFLGSKTVREKYFKKRAINTFWKEFDFSGQQYMQTRMSAERIADRFALFNLDTSLQPFLRGKNKFDIKEIAANEKIVIFDLKGLGDQAMALLGQLVTSQIRSYHLHQASEESPPLYVFVDELHWFITRGYERMLVECAKHNMGWIMAIHGFAQVDKKLSSMMLGTCLTKVFLGGDYKDADMIMRQLNVSELGLEKYEALIGIGYKVFNPVVCFSPPNIDLPPRPNFLVDDKDSWMVQTA